MFKGRITQHACLINKGEGKHHWVAYWKIPTIDDVPQYTNETHPSSNYT